MMRRLITGAADDVVGQGYTRNTKKVLPNELRVGSNVVVDALGDSIDELEAVEVRLIASLPAPPAKQAPRTPR